jgi:cellobiose phosphorylase
MSSSGTILSFYQNHQSAVEAVRAISRGNFSRCAAIHKTPEGRVRIRRDRAVKWQGALWSLMVSLLAGLLSVTLILLILLVFYHARLDQFSLFHLLLPPVAFTMTVALLSVGLYEWARQRGWNRALRRRFAPLLVRGETLVVVEAESGQMASAFETLRTIGNEPPTSFVLRPSSTRLAAEERAYSEPLSPERLREQAQRLASSQKITRGGRGKTLLSRLGDSRETIENISATLSEAAQLDQSVSISGEWLLDNAFLIQGQIKDVRNNLPRQYYRELPVLKDGNLAGSPRIYAVAFDLISHTDARVDATNITDYLKSYQEIAPLTLGELWAMPLLLRLALIEQLRRLAEGVAAGQVERERADFWANRLLFSARRDPDQMLAFLAELSRSQTQISPHFADRLRSQLQDEESALIPVQSWLERRLNAPFAEIVQSEQRRQATDQLSIANIIGSLRALLDIDWREIFEDVSLVHHQLQADPARVYSQMDFATRDRYRHAVEEISHWAKRPELEVARTSVHMASEPVMHGATDATVPHRSHIGYFLVDNGRGRLETRVGAAVPSSTRLQRAILKHAGFVYIGGIALVTTLIALAVLRKLPHEFPAAIPTVGRWILGFLILLPASDVAVQAVDYLLTRLLPPRALQKMSFENGIPDEARTLVVVPMLTSSLDGIREDVERLEVRYLANSDLNLQFALLSDYADADAQHQPEDQELLDTLSRAIEDLNVRYGNGKFFLFHRERSWSKGENKWIGWERKRGKLEEMNALLVGDHPNPQSILRVGNLADLQGIHFVITLDADTQLPHDSARAMIETLAHPLNRPRFNTAGIVSGGYGIIQPRVSTALPSAVTTRFSRLFTDSRGTDPYTHLVSNVYQDLSGEGAYHGKGIYDLHAFHRVLDRRFPDATLLSHDLIEGAHVRVGLATDIELFDQFPSNYLAYGKRNHRWIRGDWQISNWAFGRVPKHGGGTTRNLLTGLNRWKIFDNLRRSLVPIATLALLLISWLCFPDSARVISKFVVLAAFVPTLTGIATWLTTRSLLRVFPWRDWAAGTLRAILGLALLPHQAGLNLDAIVRVWYRRTISHRHLLEWQTSQDASARAKNQSRSFIWRLAIVSLLAGMVALWLLRTAENPLRLVERTVESSTEPRSVFRKRTGATRAAFVILSEAKDLVAQRFSRLEATRSFILPKGHPFRMTNVALENSHFLPIEYSNDQAASSPTASTRNTTRNINRLSDNDKAIAAQAQAVIDAKFGSPEDWQTPTSSTTQEDALWWATPFLILWALSPLFVRWLDGGRLKTVTQSLSLEERTYLRHLARQTWRYFDDFIGPQSAWLPPDNYQEYLNVEVAPRTSPTNIGLWLLSALGARDFGYLSLDQVVERCNATMETLENLERHEGHLVNWYEIPSLRALPPRYVSTVDSGNLLVSMWAFGQGVRAALDEPILAPSALHGLGDTLAVLQRESKALPLQSSTQIKTLQALFADAAKTVDGLISCVRQAGEPAHALTQVLREASGGTSSGGTSFELEIYWADALERQIAAWNSVIDRYLLWAVRLAEIPDEQLRALGDHAVAAKREALRVAPSLEQLANGEFAPLSTLLSFRAAAESAPENVMRQLTDVAELSAKSRWLAGEMRALTESLIERNDALANEMNLRPLFDAKKQVFSIGLNVESGQLDKSYYDLLASECRLASFAAIARGDVPAEHWLKLRRLFGSGGWRTMTALLSWSGTMFEYLMPPLLTKNYPNSLLEYACRAAVQRQIAYGRKRGIPWGISEAAYSALDAGKTYQYQAFGVPGLGLKRGLEDDLVVAPYATCLALPIHPQAALENLRRLEESGLRGGYGFYESIDYTRARVPEGERGVVVRSFMVHHQGMSFLAFDNVLHGDIMQDRFHADPRVIAASPLLYESVPQSPPTFEGAATDNKAARLKPLSVGLATDEFNSPDTPTPRVNLLSNNEYSIAVSAAGGGYSRWRDFDITRWRSDTTRDASGAFIYVRDLDEGVSWSTTHQPMGRSDRRFSATFAADRASFRRRDMEIETLLEIVVAPEEAAEIRRVTLTNTSKRARHLELTSYEEVALAPHAADRAHPAFSKLFVQTEAVAERRALLANRRLRSPKDTPIWACHAVVSGGAANGESSTRTFQFETDRARFLGRDHDASDPQALNHALTQTEGAVLDPVFSIRHSVNLAPGERVQVAWITGAGESRERVLEIVGKLGDMQAVERAFELAWTNAQLEMHRLRIEPDDLQFFQQLAGLMLYPSAGLRANARRISANTLGQQGLWAHGISGDLPILLVQVGSERDVRDVKQAMMAHAFWRARGLQADLVILNEEGASYEQPLSESLKRLVQNQAQYSAGLDQPGGVFLRAAATLSPPDMTLLLSAARVVINASRGGLSQQLGALTEGARMPSRLVISQRPPEEPSSPLPFMELPYFNSLGGFTTDGREYAIYLGPHDTTPAPWVNVLANPRFGSMISESGPGYTWCDNSQANKITPWSNDPVSDLSGEAIYIRDEETGTFWSPTALPIRELDPYRARHGQGYSVYEHNSHAIEQELITFVPIANGSMPESATPESESSTRFQAPSLETPTVRVQRLRLRNTSSRRRRLSVTNYVEWVMGTTREETQMQIVTRWDGDGRLLLARNSFNPDFAHRVAFISASPNVVSWTGDRTEFLGRNGSAARPAALLRSGLSNRTGAALDPCGALQVAVEIEPHGEVEVIFVLGEADTIEEAQHLARRFRDRDEVERSLHETSGWWNDLLERVQVKTPDLAVDFMMNRWLLYQTLCCRIWGRSAFYQSGGAYGFRDQLQDVMAVLHSAPHVAREQILRAAQHQFKEGDVQHWWHPPGGAGVRTRFSDDLLWLPYVVSQYVRVTGDWTILNEEVPFLEGKILEPNEHEIYSQPQVSSEKATIFEHCRRSIEKGLTQGPHGLPLIGIGDWNDGMSRVGVEGKGESVWLAWFLIDVLNRFAEICTHRGDAAQSSTRTEQAKHLAAVVEDQAWDGEWYRRAYFDNGSPLGSHLSDEAKIDSLAQTWSILSGAGNHERSEQAMQSMEKYLMRPDDKMVLLFTPPFDKSAQDPGYIKGYVPGVRENGGQYTHAALWVAQAFARKGDGDRAVEVLRMLNPIEHARTPEEVERYKVEPYVVAADVYALKDRVGQGGWTWYTGSSSWMYRVWLEDVLGVQRRGDVLHIVPNVPRDWNEYSIRYKFGSSVYSITVHNPDGGKTVSSLEVDGANVQVGDGIALVDDGREHEVRVMLS